ncbi:hypothetical protein TrispH2_007442 [Trichoplax sp. H2]|nr:hypothetical protein TrispH2_007442 [Trichoplax sp. H2]|eukprot:RDD40582.1 hypothetical protein TrispH2_007442 [Trichoplax sp. H2]
MLNYANVTAMPLQLVAMNGIAVAPDQVKSLVKLNITIEIWVQPFQVIWFWWINIISKVRNRMKAGNLTFGVGKKWKTTWTTRYDDFLLAISLPVMIAFASRNVVPNTLTILSSHVILTKNLVRLFLFQVRLLLQFAINIGLTAQLHRLQYY